MRLLDICCGAGGAAMGYCEAGFSDIVGVDLKPQPNYSFDYWQMDALTLTYENLEGFDFIHASPPCQAYSRGSILARQRGKVYLDLLEPVRRMLFASGKPYVIENVVGAPIRPDICLCGTMFGLGVLRHRYFETNIEGLTSELVCNHQGSVLSGEYVTVAGNGGRGGKRHSVWAEAMGIFWMTRSEIKEAIPPAYTRYIGEKVKSILMSGDWKMKAGSHEKRLLQPLPATNVIYGWTPRLPGL